MFSPATDWGLVSGPWAIRRTTAAFTCDDTTAIRSSPGAGPAAKLLRAAGLRHGVQTVRRLLSAATLESQPVRGVRWTVPGIQITDRPWYAWRGAMLDVARHFQSVSFLRRFTDVLGVHKLDFLRLQLTGNQGGWRMPIAACPRLTEVAWVPPGGAHSREELRDLVEYAADRGVTVVPETEMPGHTRAALAAYPHLGNVPEWHRSPAALRRVAEEGPPGPRALHGWFMEHIRNFLASRGSSHWAGPKPATTCPRPSPPSPGATSGTGRPPPAAASP